MIGIHSFTCTHSFTHSFTHSDRYRMSTMCQALFQCLKHSSKIEIVLLHLCAACWVTGDSVL